VGLACPGEPVLSTLTVHITAAWATSLGWGRLARTVTAQATNLGTFGVLWVFQYVLCDRLLFRSPPVPVESLPTAEHAHLHRASLIHADQGSP
jgi:hypothetical protein